MLTLRKKRNPPPRGLDDAARTALLFFIEKGLSEQKTLDFIDEFAELITSLESLEANEEFVMMLRCMYELCGPARRLAELIGMEDEQPPDPNDILTYTLDTCHKLQRVTRTTY